MANTQQNRSQERTDDLNDRSDESESPTVNRRRYLQLGGAAVASVVSFLGTETITDTAGAESTEFAAAGYGGAPALQHYLSPTRFDPSSETGAIDPPSSHDVSRLDTDGGTTSRLSAGTDWYAFDTTGVSDLTIKYDRADPRGVSGFALYDGAGTLVDQAYVAVDRPVYMPTSPAEGLHYLQVSDIYEGTGDYALSLSTSATTTPEQSPYAGTVSSLPGRIPAENFDVGGEGVAYHDTSDENKYDTSYRDSAVDLRETQDESGEYNVGYFQEGEWLEYTVDPTPGTYTLHLRLATIRSNRKLELSLDGETLTTVDVPNTGGWRTWETVTVDDVSVATEDQQVLRVEALNSGIDFNWIEFEGLDLQGPFEGNPAEIPGRIEAEDYDTGGEGLSFHDTTSKNKYDTSYRDSAVDIRETQDESGEYNVGYFEDGEWLEYTSAVEPGRYNIHVRVASERSERQLALTLDGEALATVDVPNTGGWRIWETATLEDVKIDTGGDCVLRVEAVGSGIDFNWMEFEEITVQSPFGGTPGTIPGRIQAQDYDVGGEGVAYHDTSPANKYDTSYRNSAVDIRETQDESGEYNVGYFEDGEWLEYTVDPSPGTYELRVRLASDYSGRELAVSLGGQRLATVDVPNTGGWRTWETVTIPEVSVESEQKQILRLEAVGSGIDFNWVEFGATTSSPPSDGDDGDAEDGYGAGGYGATS